MDHGKIIKRLEKVLYSAAMLSNIVVGNDLEFNFMSSGEDQGFV